MTKERKQYLEHFTDSFCNLEWCKEKIETAENNEQVRLATEELLKEIQNLKFKASDLKVESMGVRQI